MSVGQSETQKGVSVSTGLQQGFFEFGGMYRLGPVSLGQAGRLAFEPLAGGRFMWIHESLGGPNQKVTGSADVIDPIVGGRITYSITDTVELWFRGDVGGFGISDGQSNLTYNLIGGVNWRFAEHWSAEAGWRYMNIDVEKGSGAGPAMRTSRCRDRISRSPSTSETAQRGVMAMEDNALLVKAKFMAKPGEQFAIRREAYLRIKQAFDENGIKFAHRQVTVHVPPGGGGPQAPAVATAAAAADEGAAPVSTVRS